MGMRKRYDATGKCIGAHNMVFDEIPDDYDIKRVILDEVIAVLIHECMHYYLRATALGFEDRMKKEILTDTATIYFGFFECINRGYIHAGYI